MTAGILKKKFGKPNPPNSSDDDEDYGSFFSRSDETFKRTAAVLAEKKREEEAEQKKGQNATKVAEPVVGATAKQTTHESRGRKRARSSLDRYETNLRGFENDGDDRSAYMRSVPARSESSRSAASQKESVSYGLLNREYVDSVSDYSKLTAERKTIVVDIETSSDEDILPVQQTLMNEPVIEGKLHIASEEELEAESDPELLELSRRAREKARNRYLAEETKPSPASAASLPGDSTSFGIDELNSSSMTVSRNLEEPIVHYLIDSTISGTRPLITARKFSQRLKESRLHWCHQQGFPDETTKNVVLTFKKSRIYDSTSCKGLGFDNVNGNIVRRSEPQALYKNKIHLVAIMEEDVRKLEENRLRGQIVQDDHSEPLVPAEGAKNDPHIRLVLRSQGFEDFKVKAKATNKLSRLFDAFRKAKEIADDISIGMSFDGEYLLPESLVSDHEFEDMDAIDVRVG